MRHPVTDIALLAYIAKKNARVVSYNEATKACKSSSSASRALHQLIREGLIEPKPKLTGLRYVTQYVVTPKGKQVAELALQLTQLREVAKASNSEASSPTEEKKVARKEKKKQPSKDEA
jgi:DNA-binding MarR family transcriptional regulator